MNVEKRELSCTFTIFREENRSAINLESDDLNMGECGRTLTRSTPVSRVFSPTGVSSSVSILVANEVVDMLDLLGQVVQITRNDGRRSHCVAICPGRTKGGRTALPRALADSQRETSALLSRMPEDSLKP